MGPTETLGVDEDDPVTLPEVLALVGATVDAEPPGVEGEEVEGEDWLDNVLTELAGGSLAEGPLAEGLLADGPPDEGLLVDVLPVGVDVLLVWETDGSSTLGETLTERDGSGPLEVVEVVIDRTTPLFKPVPVFASVELGSV